MRNREVWIYAADLDSDPACRAIPPVVLSAVLEEIASGWRARGWEAAAESCSAERGFVPRAGVDRRRNRACVHHRRSCRSLALGGPTPSWVNHAGTVVAIEPAVVSGLRIIAPELRTRQAMGSCHDALAPSRGRCRRRTG